MLRSLPAFGVLLLVMLVPSVALSGDVYVAPGGLDGNDGSEGSPVRQIREALLRVGAGDTIFVADGQYLGFNVDSIDGASGNPITILAQGSAAEVTVTTDRGDNRDTIYIDNSSYVVIDGLRCFNANRAGIRIQSSPFITIRNCVLGNNSTWGILTGHCDDLLIEYNEAFGSAIEHGIYTANSGDRPVLRGNIVHGNNANGIHMNGDVNMGGDGLISGALVEDNIIYDNGLAGGSGINCDGVADSIFRNNLLYDTHGAGICLYQGDAGGPSVNNLVVNNTVEMAPDGKWALQIHSGATGTIAFNNILLTRHSYRGSIHLDGPANLTGLVCDYNVITDSAHAVTLDDDSTFLTFAQWQAAGYGAHSFVATYAEVFADWGSSDVSLVDGCAAVDGGASTLGGQSAPLDDMDGIARPQQSGYDIGAMEYAPTGPVAPSIAVQPQDATVDLGQTAMFTVMATGSATLAYQWQRSTDGGTGWSDVGADQNSYATPSTVAGDSGDMYRCIVSNGTAPDATSDPATLTVNVPDVAPVVQITSPPDASTVSASVNAVATAHDPNVGVSDGDGIVDIAFELRRSGALVSSHEDDASPYEWTIDTTLYADGDYVLYATATSTPAAGGTTDTAQIDVSIDNGSSVDEDTDGDAMPDWWETLHGLDTNVDDAQGDADGDGVSNLAEFNAGTDPNVTDASDGDSGVSCGSGSERGGPAVAFVLLAFCALASADRTRRARSASHHHRSTRLHRPR